MSRTLRLPMALLTLLSLLGAGAVVLGLFEAPKTPNLVVHNGAGELALGNQVTYRLTAAGSRESVTYTYKAPGQATRTVLNGGVVLGHQSVQGPTAGPAVFGPFTFLYKINAFTAGSGGRYLATVPASQIVSRQQAGAVSGPVRFVVTVRNGVLLRLREIVTIRTTAGSVFQDALFCVSRFNNSTVQAC